MQYGEYRSLWEKAKTGYKHKVPLNVDIELTSYCNLECGFCPHSNGFNDKGDMDIILAKSIVSQCIEIGVPAIKFNLRGEPTLYDFLPDLIRQAMSGGILETMINTNANCHYEILESCLESGLSKMIISLDSNSQYTYDSIRGGNYFKVVSNIEKLSEKYGNRLKVQFVENSVNRHESDDFNSKWQTIGVETRISKCTDRGGALGDKLSGKRKYCGQPTQRLAILYDGTVINCCSDWNRSYPIGDANYQTIFTIWHSMKSNQLIADLLSGKHNDYGHCKNCFCIESYSG
jgi:molybdenum cofactor biosynthesis enzyme MoaA